MPLINCENNLILTWYKDCVNSAATGATKFGITDRKFYIPVVTLLDQVSREQLAGININQSFNRKTKPIFRLFNWSKLSRSK